MCVWFAALKQHPRFNLVLAGNRDEFFQRSARAARFWKESPNMLAGRDLSAGGTWMGLTRQGRYGVLTNYRDPKNLRADAPSRGSLVRDFLEGDALPERFLKDLAPDAIKFNGFNLLCGDPEGFCCLCAANGRLDCPEPGIHGLSNAFLNTPWPKVARGKGLLRERLSGLAREGDPDPEPFFEMLADQAKPPDEDLPDTGVGTEWERVLSSIFVTSPVYGTRASTVVFFTQNRLWFFERSFGPDAKRLGQDAAFVLDLEPG